MSKTSTMATALFLVATALVPNMDAGAAASTVTTCAEQPIHLCNKRIVETAFARWEAGGSGFFEELLSPDVVWTIEGSGPSAGSLRGRDALIETAVRPLSERLSSPLRPVSRRIWADGEHVIVQWEGVARVRDGGTYRNRYAWILRMRDGKAVEVNAFLDLPAYDAVLQRAHGQLQRRASP